MAFDTRKMLFPSQIKARQEAQERAEERRKNRKPGEAGMMLAMMMGIVAGASMQAPRSRRPPQSLDDLENY